MNYNVVCLACKRTPLAAVVFDISARVRHLWDMATDEEKQRHGHLLRAAMARHGHRRDDVAVAAGVKVRTVTNWTTGVTMPSPNEVDLLRRIYGKYDQDGDPVEAAVRGSELHEWRQDAVISFYKRNLHEQRAEAAS